jgi:apolipoprotein N-acyltransferase
MLGFSFPPFPFGILACFGLVPWLIVLADSNTMGTSLRYSYLTFVIFNVITLNWTGGYAHGHDSYMMIAGTVTMLVHPFFYFLPAASYVLVRKYLGDWTALVALPFLWVGYEYSHTLSEWSFPWITIGNSQSYNLAGIQFISSTGVLGLSLWIVVINVLAFILYSRIVHGRWQLVSKPSVLLSATIIAVYLLPKIYGGMILSNAPASLPEKTITVGIVQANLDPWEKWTTSGFKTIDLHLELTQRLIHDSSKPKPDIVLWPETAIPYFVLTKENTSTLSFIRERINTIGVPILSGLPHAVYYEDSTKAPPSAKRMSGTGERYDAFNAAAFFQPGESGIPWYGKMKMVPIAERVPYADAFYFFDFLRWGVGIGGWQIGRDSVIFTEKKTGARFNTLICYESVYPDLVAAFVRNGAEFIALITIDSWWAKMSGAYQHQRFAILRAVENRRWIARCAVGGISCYIDPFGRVYDATELFTQTTLSRTIGRESELTFYTAHGDWLGSSCLFIGVLFVAAAFGQKFISKTRQQPWSS